MRVLQRGSGGEVNTLLACCCAGLSAQGSSRSGEPAESASCATHMPVASYGPSNPHTANPGCSNSPCPAERHGSALPAGSQHLSFCIQAQPGCAAEAARSAYKAGTVRCMSSLALWRARALLEEKAGAFGKARALLEQARLKNPLSDVLWLAAVHSEQRGGNPKAAESLLAKGLQV